MREVGDGDDWLAIGPIKIFVDGGFTGPAAYTLKPYRDKPEYRGYLNMAKAKLVRQINEIHDAGLQMGIHAIGDAAIVLVVDTLTETLAARDDHRHYLNTFLASAAGDDGKNGRYPYHSAAQFHLHADRYAANMAGCARRRHYRFPAIFCPSVPWLVCTLRPRARG